MTTSASRLSPLEGAAFERHTRYLKVAAFAMTRPKFKHQMDKSKASQVHLLCQGVVGMGSWHDSGWSTTPMAGSEFGVDLVLSGPIDFEERLRLTEPVADAPKGRVFTLACAYCEREHTLTSEALLLGVLHAYDTPTMLKNAYVMKVR